MFAHIILMLTLTLKVTLKNPQLRPQKTHVAPAGQSEPTSDETEIFIFQGELCGVEKQDKSVCGPQSKCKHQIAAVEPDLPCAPVDITRLDPLLHLAPSGGVSKDRMLAG